MLKSEVICLKGLLFGSTNERRRQPAVYMRFEWKLNIYSFFCESYISAREIMSPLSSDPLPCLSRCFVNEMHGESKLNWAEALNWTVKCYWAQGLPSACVVIPSTHLLHNDGRKHPHCWRSMYTGLLHVLFDNIMGIKLMVACIKKSRLDTFVNLVAWHKNMSALTSTMI